MSARSVFAGVVAICAICATQSSPAAAQRAASAAAREGRVSVGPVSLYVRDVGRGEPVLVLHGGPDFDHRYLLPELDRLADRFHLIYYDQRGRGFSAARVDPGDVSLASEMDDIDRVREHFGLDKVVLLGHSWGAVLALEYAVRHPAHVSRIILMNPAPVSHADYALLRTAYTARLGPDFERQRRILDGAAYKAANPDTVAARYRIHFEHALARPADYETLMRRMQAAFASQGAAGILEARAVEDRLTAETWALDGYDVLPRARSLAVPTLVIEGERDFIPADIPRHIAAAIPNARLETLKDCGHFSYLECPTDVRRAIDRFFAGAPAATRP